MRAAFKGGLVCLAILSGAPPALAWDDWGDWWNGPATTDVPWYDQEPWIGTGPGLYYSNHPNHVPGYPADHVPTYPRSAAAYAVPIFDTGRPVLRETGAGAVAAHVDWCLARYRSYDIGTDTYQPNDGPRRHCRSPY